MKTAITCLCLILLAGAALAAGNAPVKKPGEEVRTDFFSLVLPAGWSMPIPMKSQANGAISCAFVCDKGEPAVAINVLPAPVSGKQLAELMSADMRKNGMKTGQIKESGKLWIMNIEGRTKGTGWFGSNGEVCAATMIFGQSPERANALLKALKTEDRSLFPENAN